MVDAFREVVRSMKVELLNSGKKLIIYFMETGYKYKFMQNDSNRVIVECIKKKILVVNGGFMLLLC